MFYNNGHIGKLLKTIILCLMLTCCKFPDDPNHTLSTIENSHTLKVGTCTCRENPINPAEKIWLSSLANSLQAKIVWVFNTQEELYRSLEKKEIDIVACEIQEDSPWKERLALSIPYAENPLTHQKNVFALPSGENAWLKYVNEYIYHNRKTQ